MQMSYSSIPLELHSPKIEQFQIGSLNVKFIFRGEGRWDVIFNINSNKFLIALKTAGERIEEFEILTWEGFFDFSYNLVKLIKNIVTKLYLLKLAPNLV